ncbi:MAG: LysM domain-containing protein [Proteobacteria bacterium]|nr:LysM domain-containing protein [Pseudomonadota bacterium]
MPIKIMFLVLASTWLCPAVGDEVAINPSNPGHYTVVEGDTLWDISGRFLTHPWQWPDIWQANPQIENPHLIYPGDAVYLTYKDGRPILNLARGGMYGGRRVKLSPSVRSYAHDNAIPPIPLDAIRPFLSRPNVMKLADLERTAYVVSSQDEHLANGSGNRIYVRNLNDLTTDKYSVFRQGGEYRDGDTNELLGHEALHIGEAIVEVAGDPATARVVSSTKEILAGDRLMPQVEDVYPDFIPRAPDGGIDGSIISVVDGVSQIGQYQVVVLDRGAQNGIQPGHVLAIYQKGVVVKDELASAIAAQEKYDAIQRAPSESTGLEHVADSVVANVMAVKNSVDEFLNEPKGGRPSVVRLPDERAGELMVFRSFENVSYGLVMNTQRPVHVADRVKNP